MSSKFLEMTPPVAAALRAGTPIVAIETGFFMRLSYPRNLEALRECEQAFWRRDCVPCCIATVDGKLKAGLTLDDMEAICRLQAVCSRSELPGLVGNRGTAAAGPSATMAIARMAGIVPVMVPGLTDSLSDLDALASSRCLIFCGKITEEKRMLFQSRGVPVLETDPSELADAFLVQRDLELPECTVAPCGFTLGDIAEKASASAMAIKKKTSYA